MTEAERFLTEAQHAWLQHNRTCDEAGITMQAYAAEHGLNLDAFDTAKGLLRCKCVVRSTPRTPSGGRSRTGL